MNNNKLFKILYYVCFVLTIICYFMIPQTLKNYVDQEGTFHDLQIPNNLILGLPNLILVITFSVFLLKKKINKVNILFPIIYLIFFIVMIVLAVIANNKLIIPGVHFSYYFSFVLFNYLLLNIYSILSIVKK